MDKLNIKIGPASERLEKRTVSASSFLKNKKKTFRLRFEFWVRLVLTKKLPVCGYL